MQVEFASFLFMKKLNAIHFSAAKELTKGEQKNLKGGTDGLIATCRCSCIGGSAVWTTYISHGECDENKNTSEWCEYGVICLQV